MSSSNTSSTSFLGAFGAPLAAVMSYVKWHSLGYAFLHFCCGWFYVIYYVLTYGLPHIPK